MDGSGGIIWFKSSRFQRFVENESTCGFVFSSCSVFRKCVLFQSYLAEVTHTASNRNCNGLEHVGFFLWWIAAPVKILHTQ